MPIAAGVGARVQRAVGLHPQHDVELPDPSDSEASYSLARSVWAFGESYRAFRREDPAFARFLAGRFDLALGALDREVLSKYPQTQVVDGRSVPAWLIVDGADATAEAMLGLAAYDSPAARRALARFAEGVAALGTAPGNTWPYGAVLPWALSRSIWHAWASQMPVALATASKAGRGEAAAGDDAARGNSGAGDARLGNLLSAAVADAASFTPHLLVAGGPQNGWNPSPSDGTQIAYGADSRLQSLLAVADAARRPGLRRLAGIAGSWYFGNNPAGAAMYDAATGVTFDGVSADGVVNRNSGAESTIHGLRSMLALDAAPDVAAAARVAQPTARHTWKVLEAETATLGGGAAVVRPADSWTGESGWSGGAYVSMPAGATVGFPGQGEPGLVEPVALAGADGRGQALARSFASDRRAATLAIPGRGRIRATSYDTSGREAASSRDDGPSTTIAIPPGGFAIAERG